MIGVDREPGFSGPVVLEQSGDVDWRVVREVTYRALDGTLVVVPAGSSTDGASVPRPVSWLVPRSGRFLPGAVAHDQAYRVLVPAGALTYRQADALLVESLRLLGVSWLLRWAMWCAVRWAGLLRGRAGRVGWWRDLPAVLAITLLVLPIVAVPTVVVALGLAVWWLLEQLVYVALRVCGRPDRYVNPPRDFTKS